MSPTLWPRELLAYDTSYFARHRIAVGDVVLFKRQGEVWVKRVFALPGSTFWAFKDYINGREWLRPIDPYVLSRFRALARSIRREGRYAEVVQHLVRPGCVFVLGDSSTGVDSRSIGEIPVIQILGRVVELPWQDLRPNGVHSEWSFPRRPGSRLI
jgi:signal peptidase I